MTDRFLEFPDAEAVIGRWLRAYGLSVAERVYTTIPENPTYPLLRYKRLPIGTPRERESLDSAYIQLEAYGTNQSEAQDLAQEARRAALELEGELFEDTHVTAVEDALAIGNQDDPVVPDHDRYIFALWIYTSPVTQPP